MRSTKALSFVVVAVLAVFFASNFSIDALVTTFNQGKLISSTHHRRLPHTIVSRTTAHRLLNHPKSLSVPSPPCSLYSFRGSSDESSGSRENKTSHKLRLESLEILPVLPKASIERSTFWYAVPEQSILDENNVLPCQTHLDKDGPLPFGSYKSLGSKKSCIMTVAVDVFSRHAVKNDRCGTSSGFDAYAAVRNIHKLIDSGFTSFQIAHPFGDHYKNDFSGGRKAPFYANTGMELGSQTWGEEHIFGLLRKETPSSLFSSTCHLTTRIGVPSKEYSANFGNGAMVKEAVGQSISRIMGPCAAAEKDSLDTVQVPYRKDSPYHLDVLNVLFDLKREGTIRSITGLNMPQSLVQEASSCGFLLDANQVTSNLIDPNRYTEEATMLSNGNRETGRKILVGSPLAGGLLTERYLTQSRGFPLPHDLSHSERRHVYQTLNSWAKVHPPNASQRGGDGATWQRFHRNVLGTLMKMAEKYAVSVPSIALRWAMQLDHLGSVVVTSGLNAGVSDDRPFTRHEDLRQGFKFHLDKADMDCLWEVSGYQRQPVGSFYGDDKPGEGPSELDLANRELWL